MATDSIVAGAGLFTTPEQYQEQQRQALYNQAVQEAKLDPYQQARVSLQTGVQGLANAGAGMLGVEDPQMKARSVLQELAGKYDTNTSGGVAALATELQQRGMQQQAFQLGQKALEMRKIEAEAQAKTAERLTTEQKNATAMADASGATRGTPEWTDAYKSNLTQLTAKDIRTSDQKNFAEAQKGGYTGTFNQWFNEQNASKAQKSITNINNLQESGITTSNVKAFGELRDKALTSGSTLETINTVVPLIDKAFTGLGGDTKLKAAQLADLFGVPVSGTSETEQLKSLQTQLKLGNAASLKGNFSDRDMQIVAEGIGQGVTASGLKGIMRNIQKDALITQEAYNDAMAATQTGKIKDYNFVDASTRARKSVNDKMQRLAELEAKAKGTK